MKNMASNPARSFYLAGISTVVQYWPAPYLQIKKNYSQKKKILNHLLKEPNGVSLGEENLHLKCDLPTEQK